MEPTPRAAEWSAWAGWASVPRDLLAEGRVRLTVHDLANIRDMADLRLVDWGPLPPHQIPLYTPKQIRHLFRLESALGRLPPTTAPDRWRSDRTPDADARWRVHDFIQNVRLEQHLEPAPGAGRGAAAPARGWESAARGWAAGAVLLAVLVLLVRALERCLYRRLLKSWPVVRRRTSDDEWPTPTVLATSRRFGFGNRSESNPHLDDSDSFPSDSRDTVGNDFPPPYSECANNEEADESIDADKPIGTEEPPPPYSACYFSNPKDGIPTVHFYGRRSEEAGQSSTDTQEPALPNVTSDDDDKISEVGCECEINDSVDNNDNQDEVTPECMNNAAEEPNTNTRQDGEKDEHSDYVVEINKSEVVSRERVIAV